jgi:hypothetical protein
LNDTAAVFVFDFDAVGGGVGAVTVFAVSAFFVVEVLFAWLVNCLCYDYVYDFFMLGFMLR